MIYHNLGSINVNILEHVSEREGGILLSLIFVCVTTADVLRFDNTFSWTRSKELSYSVRVLPPDTELVHQEEERKEDEEEDTKEQEFTDCTEDPLV